MVEQKRFDRVLQQVDEVVVAADVGELVGEQCFDRLGWHAVEQGHRQQHHRTPPAGGHRRVERVDQAQRDVLRVITASYEYHGGFRLRTLSA